MSGADVIRRMLEASSPPPRATIMSSSAVPSSTTAVLAAPPPLADSARHRHRGGSICLQCRRAVASLDQHVCDFEATCPRCVKRVAGGDLERHLVRCVDEQIRGQRRRGELATSVSPILAVPSYAIESEPSNAIESRSTENTVQRYQQTPDSGWLPASRSSITTSSLPLVGAADTVIPSELRTCVLCEKLVRCDEFFDHLENCDENKKSCEHCFEGVPVRALDDHLFRCPRNTRSCIVCHAQVQVAALGDHVARCSHDERVVCMFHGTTLDNAKAIMREGFKPSVEGLLGPGVYLSRDVRKAAAYGAAIVEVQAALGKCVVINQKGSRLQKSWQYAGYHSAWIPPQCNVSKSNLEEHCVYDARRVVPVRMFNA